MSARLMRKGLAHKYPGMPQEDLLRDIDATGGWPLGYSYLGFEHSDERAAGFTNSPSNDGWWTVVATSDDYYMWKLSPEAMARIATAAIKRCANAVLLTSPKDLNVLNSRGRTAARDRAAASGAVGRCTLQEHCRCGGDVPRVREDCANWMKGGAA